MSHFICIDYLFAIHTLSKCAFTIMQPLPPLEAIGLIYSIIFDYFCSMRLIKMTGGLGNQMFIYALYLSMKQKGINVRIDLSDMVHYHVHHGYEMHRVFHLPPVEFLMNQKLKKVVEFLFFKTVLERKQGGRLEPYFGKQAWPLIYYKGFYQNERYFADCKDLIRQAFRFDLTQANELSLQLVKEMEGDKCAVSLHVRRGDYLLPKHQSAGSVCTLDYYQRAVDEVMRRMPNARFYVFSDGMDWVKVNIHLPEHTTFVTHNVGNDSWQDMMLMSHCRHNVICNSTFSWWGAWLNAHEDKQVFCPDRWSTREAASDYVPESWVQLPTK